MTTYTVEASYHTGASAKVTFPAGKTWEDVLDWYIKWDTLHIQWHGEKDYVSFDLNSNTTDGTDWKRPMNITVYPTDEDGEPNYDIEIVSI